MAFISSIGRRVRLHVSRSRPKIMETSCLFSKIPITLGQSTRTLSLLLQNGIFLGAIACMEW